MEKNNSTRDLAFLISEIMPEEMLLEEVEKAIKNYRTEPTEKNKSAIGMFCTMWLSKQAAEMQGGMDNLINEVNKLEQREKLFTPDAH